MPTVQVPPAVGASGQFIDAVVITSSTLRQIVVLGDPATSGAISPVTSSFGVLTAFSSGGYLTRSLSSGTVTLSSNPTVVLSSPTSLSSGTVILSSNPTIISASSGVVQALFPVVSTAGFGPVTSSAGILASLSSGTVTLSSVPTVTATAGTNPWSSAPGFNMPVVNVSSGLVQTLSSGPVTISGTVTVLTASSGLVQISGIPTVIVASSAGLTQTVTVVNTSSGVVQALTTGTLVVVNVSSGLVQISGTVLLTSSSLTNILVPSSVATSIFSYVSSSSGNSNNIQSGNTAFFGYSIFNTTGAQRFVHLYQTSSAPTLGSTAAFLMTIMVPGAAGANLVSPIPLAFSTAGLSFTIGPNPITTDTGTIGNNDIVLNAFYV